MSEIKLRAYLWSDNHTNDQWIYSVQLGMIKFWEAFYSWTAHRELMQYTGLHDKNRKEIYEGDIIKKDDRIRNVAWDSQNATFCICTQLMHPIFTIKDMDEFEIIGTIYDTPKTHQTEG